MGHATFFLLLIKTNFFQVSMSFYIIEKKNKNFCSNRKSAHQDRCKYLADIYKFCKLLILWDFNKNKKN